MLNAIGNNFCYSPDHWTYVYMPLPPPKRYQAPFSFFIPQVWPLKHASGFARSFVRQRNLDIIKLTSRLPHDASNGSVRRPRGCFNLMHSQARALNSETALITFVQFRKIASSLRSDAISPKIISSLRSDIILKHPRGREPNNSWYRGEVGWLTLYYTNSGSM